MLSALCIGFRWLQILVAIVVLGVSAYHLQYDASPEIRYSIFVGVFGLAVGVLGLFAIFIDRISSIIPIISDILAALSFLAGGIILAIGTKRARCSESRVLELHDRNRCDSAITNEAFQFAGFVLSLILIALGLLQLERKGNKRGRV